MTDEPAIQVADFCAECGRELSVAFVCPVCRRIDEAKMPDDLFALFDVAAEFDLDVADLRRRFLAISRQIHPDQFGAADTATVDVAVRVSARLNDAFHTLSQPARRAAYLLERCGGPGPDEDRSVPPDVLMDTMSLRERIEQASNSGDEPAIKSLTGEVTKKQSQRMDAVAQLARKLGTNDDDSRDQTRIELRQALNALTYYDNMMDLLWSAQDNE